MADFMMIPGYALLATGILAALASLYRFSRSRRPVTVVPEDVSLLTGEDAVTVTRKILLVKKLEFYSLMLLVCTGLLFWYLTELFPSAHAIDYLVIGTRALQAYGVFAIVMLLVRILVRKRIARLYLSGNVLPAKELLAQHIEQRNDISPFWKNQAIKFIQNRLC